MQQIDVHSSTHYKKTIMFLPRSTDSSSSDADCVCCSSCSRQTSLKSCKQQDFQFYKLSLFWEKTLISLSPLKTLVSLPVRFDLFKRGGKKHSFFLNSWKEDSFESSDEVRSLRWAGGIWSRLFQSFEANQGTRSGWNRIEMWGCMGGSRTRWDEAQEPD